MQKALPVLPKAPPVAPEDRPIRALLIEDNPRLGELTVRYLQSHGILAELIRRLVDMITKRQLNIAHERVRIDVEKVRLGTHCLRP